MFVQAAIFPNISEGTCGAVDTVAGQAEADREGEPERVRPERRVRRVRFRALEPSLAAERNPQ